MGRWTVRVGSAVVAGAAIVALSAPSPVLAATSSGLTPGSNGHDISWPQCGSPYPSGGAFGMVGVTDGRAWSTNPCLASQYQWAATYPRTPDVYMNTANPAPRSGYYWPASGTSDPVLCNDNTLTTDPGCAYDYGWHTAAAALSASTSTLGSAAVGYWWLDVETGNTWNGDASSNAADLQGSIDYLLSKNVAGVGVYSTAYQWGAITGGYSTSNAAQYAAAWKPEFTSPNGIGKSPSWVAGAAGPSDAPSYCSSSFLGTNTWLVQYVANSFDTDYACGTVAPPPPTPDYSITVPSSASASVGAAVRVPVTLTSTHGWTGTVSLTVSAPSRVSASLSSSKVALTSNGSGGVTLTLSGSRSGSYTVTVTGRPAAGSSTSVSHSASTSFSAVGGGRHILY